MTRLHVGKILVDTREMFPEEDLIVLKVNVRSVLVKVIFSKVKVLSEGGVI